MAKDRPVKYYRDTGSDVFLTTHRVLWGGWQYKQRLALTNMTIEDRVEQAAKKMLPKIINDDVFPCVVIFGTDEGEIYYKYEVQGKIGKPHKDNRRHKKPLRTKQRKEYEY